MKLEVSGYAQPRVVVFSHQEQTSLVHGEVGERIQQKRTAPVIVWGLWMKFGAATVDFQFNNRVSNVRLGLFLALICNPNL